MQRNTEQRFYQAPMTGIERSSTPYRQDCIGTLKMGELIPFFSDETIMPADTFQINCGIVLRALTAKTPTMANMFLDIYFFFVPLRLIWEHTEAFFGENEDGEWAVETEYYTPILKSGQNGFTVGSIVDYLYGVPTGIANLSISAFSLRSYIKCYNDWFRDQNWIAPKTLDKSDGDTTFDSTDPTKGGTPFKIAKYHDLITSLLPSPQKGAATLLPLGTSAPVYGTGSPLLFQMNAVTGDTVAEKSASAALAYGYTKYSQGTNIQVVTPQNGTERTKVGDSASNTYRTGWLDHAIGLPKKEDFKYATTQFKEMGTGAYTDLSEATSANINTLREAFAYQRIMEKMARGGTRYNELIKSFWGVNVSNARLQRAEYLGGKSIPIDMTEIVQTSATDSTSPQGNLTAMSKTVNDDRMFTKSFEEHGVIIGMFAIRQQHFYQQGIEKQYKIRRRYERYFPQLAHIGEQPVYTEEIYATGIENNDKTVLGFQEAWWFYRYRLNKIVGYMRSGIQGSLDIWHQGDYYENAPVISEQFINETDTYLRRTLAVTDNETHQFLFASSVYGKTTRALPLYSIPGLIDHF